MSKKKAEDDKNNNQLQWSKTLLVIAEEGVGIEGQAKKKRIKGKLPLRLLLKYNGNVLGVLSVCAKEFQGAGSSLVVLCYLILNPTKVFTPMSVYTRTQATQCSDIS